LVVAGSFVSGATRQLERLAEARPGTVVEADLDRLVGGSDREVGRLATAAADLIGHGGLAVVTTPRARRKLDAVDAWSAAATLARVAGRTPAHAVVAKGGLTSALTARIG